MNLPVSKEWIVDATRRYVAEHRTDYPDAAIFLERLNALPLYADLGGGVALRPDGTLIGFV